ncbi:MAG TPA: Wzz/FepE/Etk N-terminal domain-containing protein, partial [Longimicrobiales bacterium]|nr:Wzz/FepE/Etk N-terminal domain-containing protein [Longimicrobiales bacterium]
MLPQSSTPPAVVNHDAIDLREIWNLVVRNRWLIAGCIAAVVVLASIYTLSSTPLYEASTSIRIDQEKSGARVLDVLHTLEVGSEVHTEMEVLRSRTLAESVVEQLGLQLVLRTPDRAARAEVFQAVRVARDAPSAAYRARRGESGRFRFENRTTGTVIGEFAPGEVVPLNGAFVVLAPGAAAYRQIRFEVVPFRSAVDALRSALTVTRPNREANVVIVR